MVADLPAGAEGVADLHALSASRERGELVLAVQRVPDAHGGELLWIGATGVAGAGAGASELTSHSTNQRGLVVSVDLAPTILAHLGTPDSRGRARQSRSKPMDRFTPRACAR